MDDIEKIAKYRVQMKRKLRLNGFSSSFINDLDTEQLEKFNF